MLALTGELLRLAPLLLRCLVRWLLRLVAPALLWPTLLWPTLLRGRSLRRALLGWLLAPALLRRTARLSPPALLWLTRLWLTRRPALALRGAPATLAGGQTALGLALRRLLALWLLGCAPGGRLPSRLVVHAASPPGKSAGVSPSFVARGATTL